MQDPMDMNPNENDIPNIENIQNTGETVNPDNINTMPEYNAPQITIPQYSVPQYSVPQYTVPQYQEPQQNVINNMQSYQPPTYPSFNPEPIVQKQDTNNQVQVQVHNNGGCPNSWELFSFITWILFLSSKLDIFIRSARIKKELYRPVLYNRSFVEIITLIISILGFLVYLTNIVYKKNENLYQALFNQYAKYHTFAFLLYSALAFTIERQVMELGLNDFGNDSKSFNSKAFSAFYMIFSLLTLFCITFVYFCTDMVCDWYIVMSIKKGIYSVIIAETTQHFIESIFFARLASIGKNLSASDLESLYNTGGVFFCILVFAIVCFFAILKKDIIMMLVNFLMYCGMIFNFYTLGIKETKGKGTPVVCIIAVVCQFVIMAVMIIKFKEQLIES